MLSDKRGTTLVELLVVTALFALVGFLGIGIFLATITGSAKSKKEMELQDNARFVMQRLSYEVKRARGLETTSDYGVNLATTAGSTLDLDMPDVPRDPTTFAVDSGVLTIKQGSAPAVALTTNDVSITNLQIDNRTTSNNRSKNIAVFLTVSAPDPARPGITITYTLRSAIELRAK